MYTAYSLYTTYTAVYTAFTIHIVSKKIVYDKKFMGMGSTKKAKTLPNVQRIKKLSAFAKYILDSKARTKVKHGKSC